jgi:hypothetical protein
MIGRFAYEASEHEPSGANYTLGVRAEGDDFYTNEANTPRFLKATNYIAIAHEFERKTSGEWNRRLTKVEYGRVAKKDSALGLQRMR